MSTEIHQYFRKTVYISLHFLFYILIIRFFIFEPGRVNGISMEPTYRDDRLFLIDKISPLIFRFKRQEVVQLLSPDKKGQFLIKRIVGLPGEKVVLKNNAVYIIAKDGDEKKLKESYVPQTTITQVKFGADNQFMVPEHHYFVLGDNRPHSADSRDFGVVHRKLITGRVHKL